MAISRPRRRAGYFRSTRMVNLAQAGRGYARIGIRACGHTILDGRPCE